MENSKILQRTVSKKSSFDRKRKKKEQTLCPYTSGQTMNTDLETGFLFSPNRLRIYNLGHVIALTSIHKKEEKDGPLSIWSSGYKLQE